MLNSKQYPDISVCYTYKMAHKSRVFISPKFFTYKGPGKPGNSLYLCLTCPPKIPEKFLSCSDTSKINLKKHMEAKHPDQSKEFEDACCGEKPSAAKRNRVDDLEIVEENASSLHHQPTIMKESINKSSKSSFSKKDFDQWLTSNPSIRHVEADPVVKLVECLYQGRNQMAHEMVKQIMNYFNQKSINEDKQQIEIYDGSPTNSKSAADWLEECENHAIIFQWNEENFIEIFGSRLQKRALDWHANRLESLPNESYSSWREAFKSKFEPPIHLQKKRERFYNELQQKPDEPIGHFIAEIERSFKSLYGPFDRNETNLLRDDTLTQVLMNGVLPPIKKIMIESNYFNSNDRNDWKGITEAALKAEKLIVIRRMAQRDSGVINKRFNGLKQEPNQQVKHFIDLIESIFQSCGYGPIPEKDESYDSTYGLRIEDDVLIEALMRGVLPAIKENMLKSFLLVNYDWHTFTNAAIVAETNILFQK